MQLYSIAGFIIPTFTDKPLIMKKFAINDEVYEAGKFGLRVALFVWKINRDAKGLITYTCSAIKGRNEEEYTDKQIYALAELF
jgi:hypothetical protein